MTLTQLRYLVAIADSGLNITLAAQRVHATQPGVSKQLKQLEDELGFRLFTRKGRSLAAVTPAGDEVIERARVILEQAANIRSLAANLRSDGEGELHIATTHTQARYLLPSALSALKQQYQGISVHIAPGGDGDTLARLARGEADVAIVSTAGGPPAIGMALPLYRWRRKVLVPRGHALATLRRALTLADLAAQPLVSYESSQSPESSLRLAFETQGLSPRIACTARDADLIRTYVRAGMGVGILAEMAVDPAGAEFIALDTDGLLPVCTAWLLLRDDRVQRDFVIALVRQLIPGLDAPDLRRALAGEMELSIAPPDWPLPDAAIKPARGNRRSS